MNIIALFKLVPDLVEELELDPSGKSLDMTWTRLIINELDDHAVEQAILLKEEFGLLVFDAVIESDTAEQATLIKNQLGATVTVIAPDVEGTDDVLFTAAAKGADRLIKLTGGFENGVNNHVLARAALKTIQSLQPDLILTGVQAHNDLDGSVGPLLAGLLGISYIGYISGVKISGENALVKKEYPGGLIAEMAVKLPAVLGIQASEEPPRYVAVSKVRQTMKSASIEEHEVTDFDSSGQLTILRMYKPEVGKRATMLKGNGDEIADQLVAIFKEIGVL